MALEVLRQAHLKGQGMVALLEGALSRLETTGGPLEPIDHFLAFCDGELEEHFAQEEETLFPRLEAAIGRAGPMMAMFEEHLSFWKAEAALKERLKAVRGAPPSEAPAQARSLPPLLKHILWLLRSHIDKEEKVLLPLAEKVLSPQALQEVQEALASPKEIKGQP